VVFVGGMRLSGGAPLGPHCRFAAARCRDIGGAARRRIIVRVTTI
jgi:hypothetical protein